MKSFKQFIAERNDLSLLHDHAIVMRLRDFIDALELLDDLKSDRERLVEIREDMQKPGTYAVRLVPQVSE
ncbi:MAG: hypothetical protein IPM58_07345 [Nitrospira sp.]|nr:hypothetical protein [Nitrospira sp.]